MAQIRLEPPFRLTMLNVGEHFPEARTLPRTLTPDLFPIMKTFTTLSALLLAVGSFASFAYAADPNATVAGAPVAFFDAVDDHQIDVKFIAKNDHEARVFIKNNTNQPINLKVPEAFAGVPLAQFGGGGRGGGGGFGGGNRGGGGGQQQSVGGGGGIGGGGGGGFGGGGGGGVFSVPPEQTAKVDVEVVCLDHGLRDPNSSAAYKMVRADEFLEERPAVVELLKAFGRGELKHNAVQAAAWNLNSGRSWDQLASQLTGTRRSSSRAPYFTPDEIREGMTYANAATRLAEANAEQYARDKKARAEKLAKAKLEESHERSATDVDAIEPAADKKATDAEEKPASESANKAN